jgi:hypothetical protein
MPDDVIFPVYPPPNKRLRPLSPLIPVLPVAAKVLTPFSNFIAALVARVEQTRVSGWIGDLVNFSTRHTLSPHNVEAAHWLRAQFQTLGYTDVVFHDFIHNAVTRHNVICTKPGKVDPSKYLIICAHYDSRMANLGDTTGAAPGADDNASGVAALLEIARALLTIDTIYSVQLVAFSGEEQGLIGSTAYASFVNSSGMQIPLLINLDMIGHPENPANPTVVVERDMGNHITVNDAPSQAFALKMTQAAADFTTINTALGPIYSSDYMPFEHLGYVCIGAFDGADTAPFYHTVNDTLDKVDMGFCTEVIRMVLATVLTVAGKQVGSALVFDPDPITSSGNTALTTASSGLDTLCFAVSLQGLNAADAFGKYNLNGTYCQLTDVTAPSISPPALTDGVFVFKRDELGFKDVMAYHHIDRFCRYMNTLGFPAIVPTPIDVDAHGSGSHYNPVTGDLVFASSMGTAPDDAEDAGIILHEFAHAIQSTQNPGFTSANGLGSGFGDLVPALYYDHKHANWALTRGMTAPWVGSGRRYDRPWKFDDTTVIGELAQGEIWVSTVFEIYRNLGGDSYWLGLRQFARDLVMKLHLKANSMVPTSGAIPVQMAQQIEAADSNLEGWRFIANNLHRKVIYDAFQRRNLTGYVAKAVDVYIDDGRNGAYEWLENYWDTQDIWVKPTVYLNAATQATGGPTDHIEPPINNTAYLYARVKNRGTNVAGSGPVKVRAFHCSPGIGLVWPDDWVEMDATQVMQPANVLPGLGNGIVVGPFTWTPTEVGHECVFVIVECANDRAVTQDLPSSAHVEHSALVPFDNNVAQRNLVPTAAKGKMARGFYVRNPETEVRTVTLHFDANLPEGWHFRTNLVNPKEIRLGALERRWVEVVIDQAGGSEVTHFDRPYTLTVTGTIEDRVIGGMTFYVAPESAFGRSQKPENEGRHPEVRHPEDLFCLNIPWKECEVEGEVEIKFRFHKK